MENKQNDERLPLSAYQREVCCPVHNRLLGKFDRRKGIINVTYFCPLCKQEYTFTIKGEKN